MQKFLEKYKLPELTQEKKKQKQKRKTKCHITLKETDSIIYIFPSKRGTPTLLVNSAI